MKTPEQLAEGMLDSDQPGADGVIRYADSTLHPVRPATAKRLETDYAGFKGEFSQPDDGGDTGFQLGSQAFFRVSGKWYRERRIKPPVEALHNILIFDCDVPGTPGISCVAVKLLTDTPQRIFMPAVRALVREVGLKWSDLVLVDPGDPVFWNSPRYRRFELQGTAFVEVPHS